MFCIINELVKLVRRINVSANQFLCGRLHIVRTPPKQFGVFFIRRIGLQYTNDLEQYLLWPDQRLTLKQVGHHHRSDQH
jgi:hypothetical protein